MNELDLLRSPLSGVNLIEASAGTGKTYAIAGLFLRLLLERKISVREILVMTFTVPATEELKTRIRRFIRQAEQALAGVAPEEPFIAALCAQQEDKPRARRRLRAALQGFDEAPIFTIHGFCRRVLLEFAFETGSTFTTELVRDQEPAVLNAARDFWRRHIYGESPLFIGYLIDKKYLPDSFAALVHSHGAKCYDRILPEFRAVDAGAAEKRFEAAFDAAQTMWPQCRDTVRKIFEEHPGFNRASYKVGGVPAWIAAMDEYLGSGRREVAWDETRDRFTTERIAKAMKRGFSPPPHLFFEACDRLKQCGAELAAVFDRRLTHLKRRALDESTRQLAVDHARSNTQSFDGLLNDLAAAVARPDSHRLLDGIRDTYHAALIDEFQDTDPVQYRILSALFGDGRMPFFMIGDPKQAIYSFRSADVFAYLAASRQATTSYTLTRNWRSESGLITAVNAIFTRATNPFIFEEIGFVPARPGDHADTAPLTIDGARDAPLRIWHMLPALGQTAPIQAQAIDATVAEIARLIELGNAGRARISDQPVGPSDIAVLVRSNAQASLVFDRLAALRIPCVLHSTQSLFDAEEVVEMERVLSAVAEPADSRLLSAALTTRMLGTTAAELERLQSNDAAWEAIVLNFREYNDLWSRRGFFSMFRLLLVRQGVKPRLCRLTNGERRLTNILHLAEVLHRQSIDERLTMPGLVQWLRSRRASPFKDDEEHQIRLESDAHAVKLVTIHKSKGLDYNIVFCPFTYGGSLSRDREITFHSDGKRVLDLNGAENPAHSAQSMRENLAENLRLFYVALTRARHRCYLVWGAFKGFESSSPAYLFHQPRDGDARDLIDRTVNRAALLDGDQMFDDLRQLAADSNGAMSIERYQGSPPPAPFPPSQSAAVAACRSFSGAIHRDWRVASFTALTSGATHEQPDYDQAALAPGPAAEAAEEAHGIFAFPRGARAGTFMHALFEHLDFARASQGASAGEVERFLREFGFGAEWLDTIQTMLTNVLSAPFIGTSRLADLDARNKLHEVEFYFPLKRIAPEHLSALFAGAGPEIREQSGRLTFSPARGFMKGFIDMVFVHDNRYFLVDWKSNHLGNRTEDYRRPAIDAAMRENFYFLQYSLYAVALDRYLCLRVPEYDYDRHFGGVYYLFLRGMDASRSPESGVFFDRPPRETIDRLAGALIDIRE
jgi:exodeoxyribonuclease V beta subunit